MNNRAWQLLAMGVVAVLVLLSVDLAVSRIYQVDELQNIFTARLIGVGAEKEYILSAPLFVLGPLARATAVPDRAADILLVARLLFVPIFWLNLTLIVLAAGVSLSGRVGVFTMVMASTLAPLWDYGMEVRHDNVLLLLTMLGFLCARRSWSRRHVFLVATGVICVLMQLVAHKAFVYWMPLILIAVLCSGWRKAAGTFGWLAVGAVIGSCVGLLAHVTAGTLDIFVADVGALFEAARGAERLSPLPTLLRLFVQSPMFAATFMVTTTWLITSGRRHLHAGPDGLLPELLLAAGGLAGLLLNPTPFPYNLVIVAPQMAIFSIKAVTLLKRDGLPLGREVSAVFVVVHLGTWAVSAHRHFSMDNDRQLQLIELSEAMTDPVAHRVLDGAGLVASRLPPGPRWLIHMLTLPRFADGTFPPMREQLSASATPVIILNYRTGALPSQDIEYIRSNYIPLADDFWVLGVEVSTAESTWECRVPGRYFFQTEGGAGLAIDGRTVSGAVEVSAGIHSIVLPDGGGAKIYWIGEHLDGPLQVRNGHPANVFVNWY